MLRPCNVGLVNRSVLDRFVKGSTKPVLNHLIKEIRARLMVRSRFECPPKVHRSQSGGAVVVQTNLLKKRALQISELVQGAMNSVRLMERYIS